MNTITKVDNIEIIPVTTGSEKQNQWAQNIKANMITLIIGMKSQPNMLPIKDRLDAAIAKINTTNDHQYFIAHKDINHARDAVKAIEAR